MRHNPNRSIPFAQNRLKINPTQSETSIRFNNLNQCGFWWKILFRIRIHLYWKFGLDQSESGLKIWSDAFGFMQIQVSDWIGLIINLFSTNLIENFFRIGSKWIPIWSNLCHCAHNLPIRTRFKFHVCASARFKFAPAQKWELNFSHTPKIWIRFRTCGENENHFRAYSLSSTFLRLLNNLTPKYKKEQKFCCLALSIII